MLVKGIRDQKVKVDEALLNIEKQVIEYSQEIGALQNQHASKAKVFSEISKKIELTKNDELKDKAAQRLINELEEFIIAFKKEKKVALEEKILKELNGLLHKTDFVSMVAVDVEWDIIDIHLYGNDENEILKESLSKGEQQLYATALLKALVDESNIKFPVFIDSPLQKLDKRHSKNVISEFYPTISEQVVLFPLLEKELTEEEYQLLLPKVNSAFFIENMDQNSSEFRSIKPKSLFAKFKERNHVYAH